MNQFNVSASQLNNLTWYMEIIMIIGMLYCFYSMFVFGEDAFDYWSFNKSIDCRRYVILIYQYWLLNNLPTFNQFASENFGFQYFIGEHETNNIFPGKGWQSFHRTGGLALFALIAVTLSWALYLPMERHAHNKTYPAYPKPTLFLQNLSKYHRLPKNRLGWKDR